jgi:hypothetical protein
LEEEIRHGLFRWPRYLDGRDACLRSRSRRGGGLREQVGVDGSGNRHQRLFAEIALAEAATLSTLSAKELTAHFQKRAPGQHLPKGLSKSAIIGRITKLPPLEPIPAPAEPTPEPLPAAESFSVAAYAKQHNLDGREIRKKLRAAGLRAPYTLEQVLQALEAK